VPPSLREPVPQTQNQRWRERRRCSALPVAQSAATGSFTPALVVSPVAVISAQHVRDDRAARMHMLMSEFAGTKQFVTRSKIWSARVAIFPGTRSHSANQFSRLTPSRL
jgi:hypothetical protein